MGQICQHVFRHQANTSLMCRWGRTSQRLAAFFCDSASQRSICRCVPRSVLQSLVSSLVLQRLDYGNATLACIPSHLAKRMQSVLNSAARLVFAASRYDRITPLLTQLHWLKVQSASSLSWLFWYIDAYTRQYESSTIILFDGIRYSPYLAENSISHLLTRLVSVSALHRHHRLVSDAPAFQPSLIELFRSLLLDCGTLPLNVTSASSISVFRKRLKTYLFSHSFPESVVVPIQWLCHFGHYTRSFLLHFYLLFIVWRNDQCCWYGVSGLFASICKHYQYCWMICDSLLYYIRLVNCVEGQGLHWCQTSAGLQCPLRKHVRYFSYPHSSVAAR